VIRSHRREGQLGSSGLFAHRAGKFTSAAIFDQHHGIPFFVISSGGDLILHIGVELQDAPGPAVNPLRKSLLRTRVVTKAVTGFTGRESLNRSRGLEISFDQKRAKPNLWPPFRMQQKVAPTYDAQPSQYGGILQKKTTPFQMIGQGDRAKAVFRAEPLFQ
jgi:hypothetical protein